MAQHLQQFAGQLAEWTEAVISTGRTPFRLVETYPTIDTPVGPLQPPLVFWINRQSLMTGGILLLPENNLDTELEQGRQCATALGLRHFVTWEKERVRIWEVGKQIRPHQTFPLQTPHCPELFHQLLNQLLDALKLLAVLGAIPAAELSPCYFSNLFQVTLKRALPPLVEAFRLQRAESSAPPSEYPETQAQEKNRLLLLKTIALLWYKQLPGSILPEKLERAVDLSLPSLPPDLYRAFTLEDEHQKSDLPQETAVAFHHLLLRLQQLGWVTQRQRGRQSLQRLQRLWYPPTAALNTSAMDYIYPQTPPPNPTTGIILSDSPALLGLSALLSTTEGQTCVPLHLGPVFNLQPDSLQAPRLRARLLKKRGIALAEKQLMNTQLRHAWPNRRFRIKSGQPIWVWEFIHLLGICRADQTLQVELPREWLSCATDTPFWPLMLAHYSLPELFIDGTIHRLLLYRSSQREPQPVFVRSTAGDRQFIPLSDTDCFRSQLVLAAHLPAEIFHLLGKRLTFPPPEARLSDQVGARFYRRSHLYQQLLQLLQSSSCVPYPDTQVLEELSTIEQPADQAAIDQCLAEIFQCPSVAHFDVPESALSKPPAADKSRASRQLQNDIQQQLEARGLPNFPDQYLYFIDLAQASHYSCRPPLRLKERLLDRFVLEDAAGQTLTGFGKELEQALILAAQTDRTEFDLPNDRQQLIKLLELYLTDLHKIYNEMQSLCYSQITDERKAKQLLKTVWASLKLPDLAWLQEQVGGDH